MKHHRFFIQLFVLITVAVVAWPTFSQAVERFTPGVRELNITKYRHGYIKANLYDDGNCSASLVASDAAYLGPAEWSWEGQTGNPFIGETTYQEKWLVYNNINEPFNPQKPIDGGWVNGKDLLIATQDCPKQQIVKMNYVDYPNLANDTDRYYAFNTGRGDDEKRDYLVMVGGQGGALLAPRWWAAPDCHHQETCEAYQQGTLFSLPVMWEATLTVTAP